MLKGREGGKIGSKRKSGVVEKVAAHAVGVGVSRLLFSFSCRQCVRACECLACFCEILRDSGDGCRAVGSTYQTQEKPFLPAMAVAAAGEKAGRRGGGGGCLVVLIKPSRALVAVVRLVIVIVAEPTAHI